MSRIHILVLFLVLGATVLRAEAPLALVQPEARQDRFVALHGAEARDTYHGEALGKNLWIHAFGSSLSGDGPHGRLNLHLWGSSATGSSGNTPVNLHVFGSMVRGSGPLGNVSLSVHGSSIFGRVGNENVNVSVHGGWASGWVAGHRFSLNGFGNLNPAGVAVLIGAL